MKVQGRLRVWLSIGTAVLAFVLALVTVVWRDWIEIVFGMEPDAGSGALEWAIVAGLLATSGALTLVARHEHKRATGRLANSTSP
jgi:hypothetical protein